MIYQQTGLTPGTEYAFTVQARDKSPAQTTTSPSSPASATTNAPDATAPLVTLLSPANGASGVPINSDLEITFDEGIAVGTGLITIKNLSDATELTIDVTDNTQVATDGADLTINPVANLLEGKDYAIQIAATAIDDLAGNSFGGITDDVTWAFSTPSAPPAGLLLSDGFETPDVTVGQSGSNSTSQIANTTNWVRADGNYRGSWNGIEDEGAGQFTDPVGEQSYAFRYTNSGVTTAPGVLGNLTPGITYNVSFDVLMDGYNDGRPYSAGPVTFAEGADRTNVRSRALGDGASLVLASVSGDAPDDGSYLRISFSYTTGDIDDAAVVGQDLALRITGASTSASVDNVEVSSIGPGGPGPVDKFTISAIASPQTVGSPITGITITAQDVNDNTATDFSGTVTFGGTGGFSGTSANFVDGVLSGVSVTPITAGSNLTLTVDDGAGHAGTVTIATIQTPYDA